LKFERPDGTLAFPKEKWQAFELGYMFDYSFLDEVFNAQYKTDEQNNKVIGYFTLFAIFIACLGLYGMASFMSEQ